ncbi:aldehyde oxidase and xanthine dehydrogenase, molybdopterin binding domain protein [Aeromicrobium marinum DSM 15272]|uniref:Aldehyde oxidase and xanthine dehydrogenase, molybdopterin binding domain protein n=1 Tax=Aeromicrobium marinum DSM 15272 TaxID=585531 RepID=E2SDE0_9ACTN|nr:molybdopterin cofactor-binding domain-containing protein [Aeromicrobium marinum]EFQ82517.1 aldehyde oxidase and xanthine dehydrogenase, molybdopterin binding domain protein [Aeromicrobium marinum DSM 15272]
MTTYDTGPVRDDTTSGVAGPPAETGPTGTPRRRFLTYLVAAPTLTVAAHLGLQSKRPAEALQPADLLDLGELLILAGAATSGMLVLEITAEGRARLELPRSENGQGITTAFAMLVADELDMDVEDVDVELSDATPELLFNQLTGGSNTVRSMYHPVRETAAAARGRLMAAASEQWGVPVDKLSTSGGSVVGPGNLLAAFSTLTVAAATGGGNLTSRPKSAEDYKIIGKPRNRIDARKAVTGQLKYATDLDVPGAMPTMVARPPTINGSPISFNEAEVRRMPGVLDVAMIETGVAIRAETFGQALDAKMAVDAQWTAGTIDGISDEQIFDKLRGAALPFLVPPLLPHVDAEFDFHTVSHAPLEPNSAIADVRSDGTAEIWAAAKSPIIAQQTIASELGLSVDDVTFHVLQGGGSFGRRLFFDAALEAARASKAFGAPVRLLWTRIDDTRHGRARAASHHKVRATMALGQVLTYEHRVASVETDLRHGLGEMLTAVSASLPVGGNLSFAQTVFLTTVHVPYKFGVVTELLNEVPLDMHTGSWRSVYSANTRGAEEIVVDEIAAKLGKDPVEFRMKALEDDRQRAVLQKCADEGEWGKEMPEGFAQGIAFHDEYKSCTACLVEIDARDPQDPRVTKATIVVDTGLTLNPRGLEGQMLGGLSDAISTTLRAGLHIVDGLPLEGSYSQFKYARQADQPTDVKIHIITSSEEPGGAGELGVPAAVGAIANAYARATGTKPRSFPIIFPVDFEPFPKN